MLISILCNAASAGTIPVRLALIRSVPRYLGCPGVLDTSLFWRDNIYNKVPLVVRCSLSTKPQRPSGGGRPLRNVEEVFKFNNWDNVVWDEEQEEEAKKKVETNSQVKVASDLNEKYEKDAGEYWDKFYMQHQNRFFKDRHWLFTEFPELAPLELRDKFPVKVAPEGDNNQLYSSNSEQCVNSTNERDVHTEMLAPSACSNNGVSKSSEARDCNSQSTVQDSKTDSFPGEHAHTRLFEVGCGVGNTVFPVLQTNNDPGLFVYCCDLSSTAVELVKTHSDYNPDRCHAFVADITDTTVDLPFPENSLDVIILIFVLSAIKPEKMLSTIQNLSRFLKPGGKLLFRDYGRYDLAQLRFKNGSCLDDNFYVRGDGTRVYFFTQEELREMFTKAGLEEEQNYIDRRLQVNRGRQLKMYRVWIQCKYYKPKVAEPEGKGAT